jgi:thioredoxin 1
MRNYRCKSILVILIFITAFSVSSFGQNIILDNKAKSTNLALKDTLDSDQDYKVTFIELGSVRCIPCRKMQPIMKSIEEKYGREVRVVFHDVLTEAGEPYALEFGIEAIPTQVFLDKKGKEFYRHVGFFCEGDLVRVLQTKGVKPN